MKGRRITARNGQSRLCGAVARRTTCPFFICRVPLDQPDFTTPKLAHALQAVQQGGYASVLPTLNSREKALLYYYAFDGSEAVKGPLRAAGANKKPLGQALAATLAKLPPYNGPVYSAEFWDETDLKALRLMAATGTPFAPAHVVWPTFSSASTSRRVALEHLNSFLTRPENCLLCRKQDVTWMRCRIGVSTAATRRWPSAKYCFCPTPGFGW